LTDRSVYYRFRSAPETQSTEVHGLKGYSLARTRSKNYSDNQNLILETAARLFAEQGFHRASISELAQQCEFSKAWIYHYFDSKEAILFALLSQHLSELQQLAVSNLEPILQFREYVHDCIEIYVRKVNHHVVLNRDIEYLPAKLGEQIRKQKKDLLDRFSELLLKIRPELSSSPGGIKPQAMIFFGMLNWTYTWYDPKGPLGPQDFADLAVDLYLNGF